MKTELGLVAILALAVGSCVAPRPRSSLLPPAPHAWPVTQALVGVSYFDDLDLAVDDVSPIAPASSAIASYSSMPTVGVVAMQPLTADEIHFGLEGAIAFSWWVDHVDVPDPGFAPIDARTELFLFDLSLGPYVSTSMSERVRAYAAVGGSLYISTFDVEYDVGAGEESDGDSGPGLGTYARVGVEVQLADGNLLGIGIRAVDAELELDSGFEDVPLEGVQFFLTYSTGSNPYFSAPAWP